MVLLGEGVQRVLALVLDVAGDVVGDGDPQLRDGDEARRAGAGGRCRRRPGGRGGWRCRCSCRPSSRGSRGRAGPGCRPGRSGTCRTRRSVKPEQVQVARALAGPRLVGLASPVSARRNFGIGTTLLVALPRYSMSDAGRAARYRRCCSAVPGWGPAASGRAAGTLAGAAAPVAAGLPPVSGAGVGLSGCTCGEALRGLAGGRRCGRWRWRSGRGRRRAWPSAVRGWRCRRSSGPPWPRVVTRRSLASEICLSSSVEVAVDLVEGLVGYAGQLVAHGRALDLRGARPGRP